MGFPTACDRTLLYEHPCLVTFGPRNDFWVEMEVGEMSQFLFKFLKSPFHGLSKKDVMSILNEQQCLVILGPSNSFWMRQVTSGMGQIF